MRKGSSGELVRIVAAMNTKEIDVPMAMLEASRGRITFRRQHVKSRILPRMGSRFFLHNGAAVPAAGLRCAVFSNLTQSRNCKSLPEIPPRSRKRCKHLHRDKLHTPSPRWTSSVRVDEDPRAPSDWQFRQWRACAPWQSRPLPRCLHWTQHNGIFDVYASL